ncbi:tail fiber protein [Frischella sp. Ac48]|uniref:phage tail protein n=1 Tax=Frischella sp. Ac48 TaxID=2804531 RepID=UPI0021080A94|nr:tail fiber protein [Frischella sp. Ac48]
MKIQKHPDYLIFAQDSKSGELLDFPDVSRGWGITIDQTASKPPMEWMNGAFNRIDKNMLYLLQQGVPEWSEQVFYPVNAIIKYNGIIYIAKVENESVNPISNVNKWTKLIPEASTEHKGIVQLSSAIDSTSEALAATPKAVKTAVDKANSATTVANTAKANAATAQSKADSAYILASTANTTANTAKSIAETNASTTAKGRVQLNSAVNSTVENQAATPKAVKAAYDKAIEAMSASVENTALKSTNGWWKCGKTGVIIQFGRGQNKAKITFPLAFPTYVSSVSVTINGKSNGARGSEAQNITNTGFTPSETGNGLAIDQITYIAIGY